MLLKVQVEGGIKQVWNYLQDLQLRSDYELIHKELRNKKFTDEYIQVMCYLKQIQPNPVEDLVVSLKTTQGQTIQIPLKDALMAKIGHQVLIIGQASDMGEDRS
mgnify:CR=1 FL=1